MSPSGFSRWDSAEVPEAEEDMRLYLETCFAEDEGDGALVRHALGVIARARHSQLAREGLYKALSPNGNPSFDTIMKVTRALGLRMTVAQGH